MGFLENLVKVFPSLRERPLILTGESYAGTYIVSCVYSVISVRCSDNSTAVHHEDLFQHEKPTCESQQVCYR